MQNKGQGAIEYLLIIGSAILVVAIVIIAITGALGTGQTQVKDSNPGKTNNPLVKLKDDMQGLERIEFTFPPGTTEVTLPLAGIEYPTLSDIFSNAPGGTQVLLVRTGINYIKNPDDTWFPDASQVQVTNAENFRVTTPQEFLISVAGIGYTTDCQSNINFLGTINSRPTCCDYYPLIAGCLDQNLTSFWKLDETSGKIFSDFKSTADGQCFDINCPSPTTGLFGTGGQLFTPNRQNNQYIQILNPTRWNDSKVTYVIWFYPIDQNTNTIVSFLYDLGGGANSPDNYMHGRGGIYIVPAGNVEGYVMNYSPGNANPALSCYENGFGVKTTNRINLNQWNMLAFQADYTGVTKGKLYLNGVLSISGTSQKQLQCNNETNIMWIGRRKTGGDGKLYLDGEHRLVNDFNGIIDEVAVWKRHLTDAEIIALWNNGSGRRVPG